jgi:Ca2+-transporting ATPase
MGLVAFSLMLVIAAFESRDQRASILTTETFDNRTVNITMLIEIALAVLIVRGGTLTDLLGAAALTDTQWLIGAAPALLLFIGWELGKAIARGRTPHPHPTADQPTSATSAAPATSAVPAGTATS